MDEDLQQMASKTKRAMKQALNLDMKPTVNIYIFVIFFLF